MLDGGCSWDSIQGSGPTGVEPDKGLRWRSTREGLYDEEGRIPSVKIQGVPFSTVDWETIVPVEHPGKKGIATWRTVEKGNVRARIVEYSPGYVADHWCSRGHVVFVLKGELVTELKDGKRFVLKEGDSYQVAEDEGNPHLSRTEEGARLFIVD